MPPRAYDALLVLSFGGPEGMDDVMPFLENVTRGRNIPRERLEEVAEHYAHFGGVSPINAQNRALIAALERELAGHGIELPIYFGNRNWHPLLQDTIAGMRADGVEERPRLRHLGLQLLLRLPAIPRRRRRALWTRLASGADMRFDKIRVFYNHPGFVEPMAQRVRDALRVTAAGSPRRRPRSSSPRTASRSRWPRAAPTSANCARPAGSWPNSPAPPATGSPGRAAAVHRTSPGSSPTSSTSWTDCTSQACDDVIVVPIGFISDHLEVLFDLDVEAQERARELGMNMIRVATVGTDPVFVAMIRELIEERLPENPERRFLGELGAGHDVCPVNCCQLGERRAMPQAAPERATA